jgi:hypothetical protein
MKTHWLFGDGPTKALNFAREIEAETDRAAANGLAILDGNKL